MTRIKHALRRRGFPYLPKRRGILLHQGRCGSSVLAHCMRANPDLCWDGELFERIGSGSLDAPMSIDAMRRRAHKRQHGFYGFEIKYLSHQHLGTNHLNMTPTQLLDTLKQAGVEHYCVLGRRNVLRRIVSFLVGAGTGKWRTRDGTPKASDSRVHVPVRAIPEYGSVLDLCSWIRRTEDEHRELLVALEEVEPLVIEYERDLYDDPRVGYRKLCSAWKIPAPEPQFELRKGNDRPLHDLVENIHEVEDALSGTQWEWMLK